MKLEKLWLLIAQMGKLNWKWAEYISFWKAAGICWIQDA